MGPKITPRGVFSNRFWELVGGRCRPVRHTRPALPTNLPALVPIDEVKEVESEELEDENSDTDFFDSDWRVLCL